MKYKIFKEKFEEIKKIENEEERINKSYEILRNIVENKYYDISNKLYNLIINDLISIVNFKDIIFLKNGNLYLIKILKKVSYDNWKLIDVQENKLLSEENYILFKRENSFFLRYSIEYAYDKIYSGVSFILKDHFEIKNRLSTFTLILIIYFCLISFCFNFLDNSIIGSKDIIIIKNQMDKFMSKDGITFISFFFDQISISILRENIKMFKDDAFLALLIFIIILLHQIFLISLYYIFRKEILLLILPIIMYYLFHANNSDIHYFKFIFVFVFTFNIFVLCYKFYLMITEMRWNNNIIEELYYFLITTFLWICFEYEIDYRVSIFTCFFCVLFIFHMINKNKETLDCFLSKASCSFLTLIFSVIFVSEKSFIIVKWIYDMHVVKEKFIGIALFEKAIDGFFIIIK